MREYKGKLKLVNSLLDTSSFSLDIGAKTNPIGKITLDIDKSVRPAIVGDTRYLPFKKNFFEVIFFLDVIEHLPLNSEPKALEEIHRVLQHNGRLVLTTPIDSFLYTFSDAAFWFKKHRH